MTDLVHIAFQPNAEWDHSRFPHPLVTADYDAGGRLIGITAAGPMAKNLDATVQQFVSSAVADERE